jgi:hypothetical protein
MAVIPPRSAFAKKPGSTTSRARLGTKGEELGGAGNPAGATRPKAAEVVGLPPRWRIDRQKITSYKLWLSGQLRLLERGGVSPDDLLFREIQQQLLQLEQSGGSP